MSRRIFKAADFDSLAEHVEKHKAVFTHDNGHLLHRMLRQAAEMSREIERLKGAELVRRAFEIRPFDAEEFIRQLAQASPGGLMRRDDAQTDHGFPLFEKEEG